WTRAFGSATFENRLAHLTASWDAAPLRTTATATSLDSRISGTLGRHELSVGVAATHSSGEIRIGPGSSDFGDERYTLYSFYTQTIWSITEAWALTAGLRVDDTEGFDASLQPTLRLMWSVSDRQRLWGAVSRARAALSRL